MQVPGPEPLRAGTQPLVPLRGGHLLHHHPLLDILLPPPDQGTHQGQPEAHTHGQGHISYQPRNEFGTKRFSIAKPLLEKG